MKIRIYTLFIISLLTISCKSEVAREKRPQGKIVFRGLTYFNPTLAIGSYRKTGSTSGGSGVDTTSKGFVDIFKDKIIIEYQKSPGLSSNENIEWSDLLIEQYSHRINFNDFLENKMDHRDFHVWHT